MNAQTPQTQTPAEPQKVIVTIEVEYELKPGGLTLTGALAKAATIIESAKTDGTATGMVVFGRQKFPL